MGKQVDRLEVSIRGALEQYNADALDVIELVERLVQSHQEQRKTITLMNGQLLQQSNDLGNLVAEFKKMDLGDAAGNKRGVIMVDNTAFFRAKMIFRRLGLDI